ncbi:MAG: general stress protein CsbD [Nitrococcus sp.]|nr:general stress protein CsbD [Nitrococcus sp.]
MSKDSAHHHNVASQDGTMRSPYLTWNDVQGKWHIYKGKVRQRWALLTTNDLEGMQGYYEEMSGKIQQVYDVSKEEADRQIDEWLMGHDDTTTTTSSDSNPTSSV